MRQRPRGQLLHYSMYYSLFDPVKNMVNTNVRQFCWGRDGEEWSCSTIIHLVHAVQSASVMSWFVLGMIAYPEVQQKCQEELDRVIGRSRMPILADRDSLPYLCATLREAIRWRPVTPLGESSPKINLITDPYL